MKRLFVYLIILLGCVMSNTATLAASIDNLTLEKTSFDTLPHWDEDDHAQAYSAFMRSCEDILKRKPGAPFSAKSTVAHGTLSDWKHICLKAQSMPTPTSLQAKQFFQTHFDPVHVGAAGQFDGQFTGYYLPLLRASFARAGDYHVPVHGLPWDLVKIPVSKSSASKDAYVIRQRKGKQLVPYADRETILSRSDLNNDVLVWADSLVDVYFAQVQGSALVELPNKERILLGYAGKNGHPYTSIGKVLIEQQQLKKETVSMESIRQWLRDHVDQANTLLNKNASYVFFRRLTGEDPVGTEQVALTPGRSLAVDQRVIPLGAPVWLSTVVPQNTGSHAVDPFAHLMIAQDTGGAIKGAVRGDVYWGAGEQASYLAGYMNSPGQYWVLLPKFAA